MRPQFWPQSADIFANVGHAEGWPANQRSQIWSAVNGLATVGNSSPVFIAQYSEHEIHVNDRIGKALSDGAISFRPSLCDSEISVNGITDANVPRKLNDILGRLNPKEISNSRELLTLLRGQCEQAVIQERVSAARNDDEFNIITTVRKCEFSKLQFPQSQIARSK